MPQVNEWDSFIKSSDSFTPLLRHLRHLLLPAVLCLISCLYASPAPILFSFNSLSHMLCMLAKLVWECRKQKIIRLIDLIWSAQPTPPPLPPQTPLLTLQSLVCRKKMELNACLTSWNDRRIKFWL
jgi:hypothetical protein